MPSYKLMQKIHAVQRRLKTKGGEMTNADRVLWGELALSSFASESGQSDDLTTDPETVLGDLLADLMHFCDARGTDFDSALERGRNHHSEEIEEEAEAARPVCNKTYFVAGGRVERTCGEPADPESTCAECGKARCQEHASEEGFDDSTGRVLCEDCQPTQPTTQSA